MPYLDYKQSSAFSTSTLTEELIPVHNMARVKVSRLGGFAVLGSFYLVSSST